jgi:hypothetical protein
MPGHEVSTSLAHCSRTRLTSRMATIASQSILISADTGGGDGISSGNGSPVPPENPEVIEEFATDSVVFIRASFIRSSSL